MPATAPLIVTLGLDQLSFARFDAERRLYFPADRNHIPAHLTLFHHLPGARIEKIEAALRAAADEEAPFPMAVRGLRFLGRGMAYEMASAPLDRLRAALVALWSGDLTPQDAAGFRPHVTIQNKVPAPQAKADFARLSAGFAPFEAIAKGLLLWHYQGGPWLAAGDFPFRARERRGDDE